MNNSKIEIERRGTRHLIEANTKLLDENKWLKTDNERLNNIINKAIHRIQLLQMDGEVSIRDLTELASILIGSDKE